jgi:hypothetical protein
MRMNTHKNLHFTLLIRIQGRLREFNFRKRPDNNYDVDVADERGNRIQFRIMQEETKFIKGDNLPAWISANQEAIFSGLEQNEPQ